MAKTTPIFTVPHVSLRPLHDPPTPCRKAFAKGHTCVLLKLPVKKNVVAATMEHRGAFLGVHEREVGPLPVSIGTFANG